MTKRDLVSVALKVYGVIMLATTVAYAPIYIQMILQYGRISYGGVMIWTSVAVPVVGLAVGIVLLWCADSIGRLLFREDPTTLAVDFAKDGRCLLTIAVKAIGVILIALAFPQIAQLIAEAQLRASQLGEPAMPYLQTALVTQWAAFVRFLVSIAIGIYLIAGTRGLVNLIYKEPQPSPQTVTPEEGGNPG